MSCCWIRPTSRSRSTRVEPELDVGPVDELELDEDLPPVLVVAAWLDAGSTTATTPARATLASDTVVVVAFSRRRPCSRSATARATCRAASRLAGLGPCSCQLFTLISVTRPAENAVAEVSANVLSAAGPAAAPAGVLPDRAELPVFSNAQRRLSSRSRRWYSGYGRAARGARPADCPPDRVHRGRRPLCLAGARRVQLGARLVRRDRRRASRPARAAGGRRRRVRRGPELRGHVGQVLAGG